MGVKVNVWQYNGVATWGAVYYWCKDNLADDDWQDNGFETFYFYNEKAYTLFLLRWGA